MDMKVIPLSLYSSTPTTSSRSETILRQIYRQQRLSITLKAVGISSQSETSSQDGSGSPKDSMTPFTNSPMTLDHCQDSHRDSHPVRGLPSPEPRGGILLSVTFSFTRPASAQPVRDSIKEHRHRESCAIPGTNRALPTPPSSLPPRSQLETPEGLVVVGMGHRRGRFGAPRVSYLADQTVSRWTRGDPSCPPISYYMPPPSHQD